MCDRANSNYGCEIVDEKEEFIIFLKNEIEMKDMEIQEVREKVKIHNDEYNKLLYEKQNQGWNDL